MVRHLRLSNLQQTFGEVKADDVVPGTGHQERLEARPAPRVNRASPRSEVRQSVCNEFVNLRIEPRVPKVMEVVVLFRHPIMRERHDARVDCALGSRGHRTNDHLLV
jgi:hypothetical protein